MRGRTRAAVAAAIWIGAGAAGAAGCSSILGIEPNRYLAQADASTVAHADAGREGPWDCLGTSAPASATSPLQITLIVMDGLQPEVSAGSVDGGSDLATVSGAYLPGITVRACALLDPSCASATTRVTDDGGNATFDLDTSFRGFFAMNGMLGTDPGVPVTLYPGGFLAADDRTSIPAYEVSVPGMMFLAGAVTPAPLALGPDAGAGHLLVNVYDCHDHQAPGVKIAYDNPGASVPFYFMGGFPSPMATETDSFGLAGAIDVPPGTQTVTASLAGKGTTIGSATVLVRPGEVTWAWIRVRPF
jgi:hypothetical protein